MNCIEISVPTPWGRDFILKIKVKTITIMAKENLVRIRITDAYNIGYVAGKEYDVAPEEAARLIEAGKAVAVTTPETEKAIMPKGKIEKRDK